MTDKKKTDDGRQTFPCACPGCDREFDLPLDYQDKKVQCPKCKARFIAKPIHEDEPLEPVAEKKPRSPVFRPELEDETPDSMMQHFRGRGLVQIVVFTVVVHVVVLFGSSIPFLKEAFFGADTSKMTKEERVAEAVREASGSIRDVAEKHGLRPQDITDQFAGRKAPAPQVQPTDPSPPTPENTSEGPKPKSKIEQAIETTEEGPKLPDMEPDDEEEEDDIF